MVSKISNFKKEIRGAHKKVIELICKILKYTPNVVVGGSAALKYANYNHDSFDSRSTFIPNDLDIYFYDVDDILVLVKNVVECFEDVTVLKRTMRTIDFRVKVKECGTIDVQLILFRFSSILEILNSMDLGSCQICFDYKNIYYTRLFQFSFKHRCNFVVNSSMSRIEKYETRGFTPLFILGDKLDEDVMAEWYGDVELEEENYKKYMLGLEGGEPILIRPPSWDYTGPDRSSGSLKFLMDILVEDLGLSETKYVTDEYFDDVVYDTILEIVSKREGYKGVVQKLKDDYFPILLVNYKHQPNPYIQNSNYKPGWSFENHQFYKDSFNLIGLVLYQNYIPVDLIKEIFKLISHLTILERAKEQLLSIGIENVL